MALITKIEEQKNKKRFNIFVDGAFFCGLNKETAVIFGLKEGKEIDSKRLEEAVFQSEVKSAFEKGTDYLAVRMHTKKELSDKLLKKGFNKDVIKMAISKLEDYGYADDDAFAKQFVSLNSKYSKKMLENKLKQKGVSNEIISKYLSSDSDDSERVLCEKQANKYLKGKNLALPETKQKLYASLARKGFEFDVICEVCKKILNKTVDDDFDNFD